MSATAATAPVEPAPSWLVEVPFAHRGLHGDGAPENSLAAFAAAADAGYGVELDVHLSSDEVPVISHDPSLTRLAGIDAKVGSMTAAALAQVRIGDTDERVPTLADALALLRDVPVMVEVKQGRVRAGRLERRVAEVLAHHEGPWCIAGFNPSTVRWFRRHVPAAIRVLTATNDPAVPLPGPVARRLADLRDLPTTAPHAVSYDLRGLPTATTDRWRERGGALVTWTAVGDAEVAHARDVADNVIFEHARP